MTNNRNGNGNGNANVIPVPVGFRFRPTDEELLLHYLNPKLHSLPLPSSVIPTHSLLFHSHPSHLPGEFKEKRYFFCKRKTSYYCGNKSRVTAVGDGSGYWKAIGKFKTINVSTAVIGTKKSLVFYQTTPHHHALKTHWLMVEYTLLRSPITFTSTQEMEDWVICCVYQRRSRKPKPICDGVMDLITLDGCDQFGPPPTLSTSCSSDNDDLVD